ncbi:hypothetical protein Tco_1424696, partial [Tanacetum coccineum]
MDNRWQQPITQEITVLVKYLLIPLAKKTKENAYAFEYALKNEMFEDLEYKIKEFERLEIGLSKHTENVSKEVYIALLRSFAKLETRSISLELALQQCQKQLQNDKVLKQHESTSLRELRHLYFCHRKCKLP